MRFAYSPLTLAIISALSPIAYANQAENTVVPEVKLNTIVVEAAKGDEVGKTTYGKEDLERTPNSSKNITDFLKVNPNVQFSRESRAAGSQGELKPSEISINGGLTYQNKYLINGVSNTNVLDPLGSSSSAYNSFEAGSQGMAINTDLLCKLEVLDSNVSAKYGDFTGGVISAETCAPKTEVGKIHGSITYDYTESDWTRYHYVDQEELDDYEEPSADNQKEFTKQGVSANIYGRLTEDWGFNAYASKRQSIIPVMSGYDNPEKIDQERNNNNLGFTAFYTPSEDFKLKLGIDYGDLESQTYTANFRDSAAALNGKTFTQFAELEHRINNAVITHKLNHQTMNNRRTAENNYSLLWHYAAGSKDWRDSSTVGEGAITGDLDMDQESLSYSTSAVFDPIKIGNTSHIFSLGAGYDHYDVSWKRPEDVYMYNTTTTNSKNLNGASCLANDPLCDEATTIKGWAGQYFAGGTLYKAGEFKGRQDKGNFYIEDEIFWKNVSTRLGVRADYNSLTGNFNIAPRTNITYKPLENDTLKLLAGWNRYYGSQTLVTELQDSIAELKYTLTRKDQLSPWTETLTADYSSSRRSDLDTPYTDETVFGITSSFNRWNLGLKWIHRDFKDEITRNRYVIPNTAITNYFKYGNNGRGEADIYTLTLDNSRSPIHFADSLHTFAFGFDYSDIFRNYTNYGDIYGASGTTADEDRLVSYNGKIISWADRPAENYNQPWTARFSWDTAFTQIPVKISNFLSYKSAYDDTFKKSQKMDYNGSQVEVYEVDKVPPRFSWDIRTTYDWNIAKDYNVIFGLTVNNLTNRHNKYTTQTISTSNTLKSEIGRQFIADVTFKF